MKRVVCHSSKLFSEYKREFKFNETRGDYTLVLLQKKIFFISNHINVCTFEQQYDVYTWIHFLSTSKNIYALLRIHGFCIHTRMEIKYGKSHHTATVEMS